MRKSLVIVESPAKARTINRYLGEDFLVRASVGHIKNLPEHKMGVDLKNNFTPQYVIIKGKDKLIKELKRLACESKAIYLATDPDREGEAICWHLYEELSINSNPNIYRVIFNEITKDGIASGMANPGGIDLNKVNAQQARRILDRLVGYKLSPLLNKKVRKGLSAGRVQSVALRLICEREREIEAFLPEEYWSITATLENESKEVFNARLEEIDNKKVKIPDKGSAEEILKELKGKEFVVDKIIKKDRSKSPLPPFITSTLEQEAVKKLGFSAKKTMLVAQQLYEGLDVGEDLPVGIITYMRTDSLRVSTEAQQQAREYIKEEFGIEYLPLKPPQYKNKRLAQEAHEAIRPTSVFRRPDEIKKYLTKDQYELYKLIWIRFLVSQMSPCLLETTRVEILCKDRFLFVATGTVIKFDGFMRLYLEGRDEEEIPQLKEGECLNLLELIPRQHFTNPPPRYTEASLIKTLEEKGIGRPSTYASILDIITMRDYVRRKDGGFYPTELGMIVNDLLVESFPRILDYGFTAEIEEDLDRVEEGKKDWVDLLGDFWSEFEETLKRADLEMRNIKKEGEVVTDESCLLCGGRIILRTSRYGTKFLGCENFPKCRFTKPQEEPKEEETCEVCGAKMVLRSGRYGQFLACSRYPECRSTRSVTLPIRCPIKGCNGKLVVRRSKKGGTFHGCSQYPKCTFATWYEPIEKECPLCGYLLVKRKIDHKMCIACLNSECTYKCVESGIP